ncbi:hypothetical protein [Streptomyces minutiscleroticus]|uniref:Uncharacterized protein n=1 Tax=Streptomyces minutiscleroticus TaxID=68238 RepID=A0A918NLD6_9ACTN|nr:hypothetical protein [Streptomyces minutiscleroticus]GGX78581.1 hypothetical protein GCM10010358_36080 [Streptomyces minutiscleroticus]
MSAGTDTRFHPATTGGAETRLRWWALALPALAFAVLLLLMAHPADAPAAGAEPALAHFLERVQQAMAR